MVEPRITTFLEKVAQMLSQQPGVKFWDIYGLERQGISISAERGAIKTAESRVTKGYAVRVFGTQGNVGFAHSNILNRSAMERTIETAVKMLAATTPDPDFKDLPSPSEQISRGKDFFDRKTSITTVEEIFDVLQRMLEKHSHDSQLYTTSGNVGVSSITTAIQNSNGIKVVEKHSKAFASFEAVIKDKRDQNSGGWWDSAIALKFLDPEGISDKGVERARQGLPRHEVASGDYPVILGPLAVGSIILEPLIGALSAENVEYQRTFLRNPLEQQIGSAFLNVKDDPFEQRLTGSRYYDDEGVPTRSLDLVKNGIAQNLLQNSYTAFKTGAELTGHAMRAGINSVPNIGSNNELFLPGEHSLEELCEGIRYGIYLDYTGDSPNLASGDFSGLILSGFLIENGKLGSALANTMMGINLRDLLARIDAVGKDLTVIGSSKVPHVRISSAKITSEV